MSNEENQQLKTPSPTLLENQGETSTGKLPSRMTETVAGRLALGAGKIFNKAIISTVTLGPTVFFI